MTRHIIFEALRKASLWKRIKCMCHVWEKHINKELGWDGDYMVSIMVDQCEHCGTQQLWILKEHKIEYMQSSERSTQNNQKRRNDYAK